MVLDWKQRHSVAPSKERRLNIECFDWFGKRRMMFGLQAWSSRHRHCCEPRAHLCLVELDEQRARVRLSTRAGQHGASEQQLRPARRVVPLRREVQDLRTVKLPGLGGRVYVHHWTSGQFRHHAGQITCWMSASSGGRQRVLPSLTAFKQFLGTTSPHQRGRSTSKTTSDGSGCSDSGTVGTSRPAPPSCPISSARAPLATATCRRSHRSVHRRRTGRMRG